MRMQRINRKGKRQEIRVGCLNPTMHSKSASVHNPYPRALTLRPLGVDSMFCDLSLTPNSMRLSLSHSPYSSLPPSRALTSSMDVAHLYIP